MQALEETNLAEELEEKELDAIASTVIEDYESDLESRSEWDQMNADWLKMFYQKDEAENPPWDGASTEGLPIFAEAVNQFQSRSYKAFFPNRYFVDAIPVGKSNREARERGERIAAHMNFKLGTQDRTYKPNKNQMFMAVALHGSDFTKTYFSQIKRRTVIERVRAADLVVPYHIGPVRIEDLERKTQIKFVSLNETAVLHKNGYYLTPAKAADLSASGGPIQEVVDENSGIEMTNTYGSGGKLAIILEQHRLLDLDDDGIAEPYIVWVDKTSRKVLRIQIRYEVDETGAPVKDKEPIEYFTHYQFMPNPDGFYGLGLGHLLGKLNRGINKLTRMMIDAGELSTTGNLTYLISEALGLPGDEFELSMGKGIKVPRSIEDLRKGFMKLEFAGPSPVIGEMIQALMAAAQRISSSSDILAGQPDKVYQPTALLSMLEQGLQLYSSVQEFIGHSMEDELNKVYRLNARYMTSEEYYYDGDTQIAVTQEDYQDDFRIVPIFDPKYSTRSQKLAKAQAAYEFVMSNPQTAENPKSVYLVSKQYAEALDMEDIDEILPEPSVPEVARIDDQNLENTYFIMPPDKRPLFDVFPDQDHLRHIQVIDKFIAFLDGSMAMDVPNVAGGDPAISRLIVSMSGDQKKEIVANLLRHRSQHLAFMYGQLNGVMDETGQSTLQQPAQDEQPQPDASQAYIDENQINMMLGEALSKNASQYNQAPPSFDANFIRGEDGLIQSMKVNVGRGIQ
jgi:chaperonin GroES